mgnify:CR=1 FL=1
MAQQKSSRYVGKKERISSSFARTEDTLTVALVPALGQLPLIQFVESNDLYLQDQPDFVWFDVLKDWDSMVSLREKQTALRFFRLF